ncbi:hypothetical protein D9M72_603230 [compost metagenome]
MPWGSLIAALYFSGWSVTMTIFFAPSLCTCQAMSCTDSWPSTGWPPVIATASLYRIL